jgi:hypothetical protein
MKHERFLLYRNHDKIQFSLDNFNYIWTLTLFHRIISINIILFIQPAGKIKNGQSRNIHKKTSLKMPKGPSDPVNRKWETMQP